MASREWQNRQHPYTRIPALQNPIVRRRLGNFAIILAVLGLSAVTGLLTGGYYSRLAVLAVVVMAAAVSDYAPAQAAPQKLKKGAADEGLRLVRTPGAAVAAAQRESFDLAVVDLFVKGGGVDLARRLTPHLQHVYLSVGPKLLTDEVLEAAIGFPVLRKRDLPNLVP